MADVTIAATPSPVTREFLGQIADVSQDGEPPSYTYAESVIVPETGWPQEEFLARFLRDIGQLHNQRTLERACDAQSSGSFSPFSFSLTSTGGVRTHFQAFPRPGKSVNGTATVTTVLVPLPAHPNAAPLESKTELFSFLEIFPAYVVLIDRDYTVRFGNRTARQIFDQCTGKKCYKLLHGRTSPCTSCPPFGLLTDKGIKVHEWVSAKTSIAFRSHSYPFETPDGETLVLQVGINITAGVRARHALDLSEQRYRSIAENLTMGLALADPEKKLITLNPRMEEWFGLQAIKGTSIDELLQYKCCGTGEGEACVFTTLLDQKKNQEKEFRLTLRAGEDRYFRLVACPILSRSRQVRAIVILLEDITDRRNMASRMQQMQRLEALGSLAGGIAHEINQPLSALHLYASGMQMLMEQSMPSREQILERLALILSQAEKIRQIISHMRALVLQEENPPCSPVRIADAVNNALGLVGMQLLDHDIKLSLFIPDTLPRVIANPVQLEQVVINLLVNAMHALDSLPPGSEKSVHLSTEKRSEDTLTLLVADTGPGVGTLHSRIFDPFFTTKAPHKGMGLGLSIIHAFVTSCGGSVEAVDNPGEHGAVFAVTLPTAADPS